MLKVSYFENMSYILQTVENQICQLHSFVHGRSTRAPFKLFMIQSNHDL